MTERNGFLAFEFLFRLFYERTYRAAYVIVRDRGLAEDAVQEAFLQAFRHIGQLRDPGKVGAWLAVIAMNRAKKLRQQATRSFPMDRIEPPAGADEASLADDRIMIQQLFRGLAPDDRQILVLKYFYDLPDKEIAVLLKIPPGTVKSRLNRVRTRCKLVLARTVPGARTTAERHREEVEVHDSR